VKALVLKQPIICHYRYRYQESVGPDDVRIKMHTVVFAAVMFITTNTAELVLSCKRTDVLGHEASGTIIEVGRNVKT